MARNFIDKQQMQERIEEIKYRAGYNVGKAFAFIGKKVDKFRNREPKALESPRSVLITGASSGIGAELAIQYAAPGVFLYLTGRNSMRLNRVAAECTKLGAKCEVQVMDIADDVAVEKWLRNLPRIDIAIANAGVSGGTVEGIENDEIREIFSVNVGGVLNIVLPMIERARKQQLVNNTRGQIAIMSSMAAFRGLPSAPAYAASKACVWSYADGLRGALKAEKIHITSIHPGYIKTPMTATNNFKMPMLMDVEKAAYIIRKGLAKKHARIIFPKVMYFGIRFLNMLPYFITDPIFKIFPKKI